MDCKGCSKIYLMNKYKCCIDNLVNAYNLECPCMNCLVKVMCVEHCSKRDDFVFEKLNKAAQSRYKWIKDNEKSL